ncbi:MAG: TRAP transporter small permease [Deltaproteobacteria bacterium]|nr:TRAP transporter small permease [Deltaproteobacteria bacterium]
MKNLKRCFLWLDDHFEELFLVLTLSAMTILIFSQTFLRFSIRKTPSWTQELAQFFQVYFVYLGASYAIKKDAHIKITFVGKVLPSFLRKSFEILGPCCFIVFCFILIYWGIPLCNDIRKFNQVSAAMRLPMYIPYIALPMGGIIMSFRLIQKVLETVSKKDNSSGI